ncbi:hypothetical protein KY285_008033 [Solanum tuberosum]|nr:hypothetical protein KY285_008033 [Solanum tuberosum]
MGALIDKIGNRDKSDLRDKIYSIIESPIFELYSTEQRIKATMVLCDDVKKMELRMGELERQTMINSTYLSEPDELSGLLTLLIELILYGYLCHTPSYLRDADTGPRTTSDPKLTLQA